MYSPEVEGWKNYNYTGTNIFSINVESNFICLSKIVLMLDYTKYDDNNEWWKNPYDLLLIGVLTIGLLIMVGIIWIFCAMLRNSKKADYTLIDDPVTRTSRQSYTNLFQVEGSEIILRYSFFFPKWSAFNCLLVPTRENRQRQLRRCISSRMERYWSCC